MEPNQTFNVNPHAKRYLNAAEIDFIFGFVEQTTLNPVRSLLALNLIEPSGDGKFRLTSAGKDHVLKLLHVPVSTN